MNPFEDGIIPIEVEDTDLNSSQMTYVPPYRRERD
jgi:hypothetical protein